MASVMDSAAPSMRVTEPGTDLLSKFDPLIAERQALLDTGVRDPFSIVMDKVLSPTRAISGLKRATWRLALAEGDE